MSEATAQWLAESRAWLDEQMEADRQKDEAAWLAFRAKLLAD